VRVVQAIAAAAPADAITGQALAWRRLLAGWGHDGEIVAEHVHPALRGEVLRLDAGGAEALRTGAVILRYSVWSGVVEPALAAPGPLVLWYHNVTPGELLRAWNPALAADCDRARAALSRIGARARALVADSAFNAAELAAAGAPGASVVPLLLPRPASAPAPPSPGEGPWILSVGRIAPSKRLEDVIKVFALYQRHIEPGAGLALVGGADGFESYRDALRALARRVGARDVRFAGRLTDEERDALYRRAGAYLCMSAHEGFCAPLVEAMAHGVPVVARPAGAVAETVGGGGLVIEGGLPLMAEALHEVVSGPVTRTALRAGAAARLAELDPVAVADRGRRALAPILGPA
jgi:glycosyltransferase involved in cell wall biosynthesis